MRQKILKLAAEHFECAEEDLEIADGQVSVVGVPGQAVKLGALALKANPMRGAVRPGTEPGLESTQYFGPAGGATASGVHAMIVEVDPQTFMLEVLKYVVVHDCGTVINPLILAGQIHGGVAQGIGNAFYEQLIFDDDGQLLNASLADYLLPTALDVPRMEIAHTVTPFAAQSAWHQGRGRSRRHSGRAVVRAGDRGRAGTIGAKHRTQRNSAQPRPFVRAGGQAAQVVMILVTGAAGMVIISPNGWCQFFAAKENAR